MRVLAVIARLLLATAALVLAAVVLAAIIGGTLVYRLVTGRTWMPASVRIRATGRTGRRGRVVEGEYRVVEDEDRSD